MKIRCVEDIKSASNLMHDSEFTDADFSFDSIRKKFVLRTHPVFMQGKIVQKRAPMQPDKYFRLELSNVAKCKTNLKKLNFYKSIAGVFDYIKIQNNGNKLTIVSQDLRIELELTELSGRFEEVQI